MKIDMPGKVKNIIERLMEHGYEAYAVGGCVRDSILGRIPNDWDVTTSALPKDVKKIFHHTVDTGIEHGTVTVLLDGEGFEVTTYRIDGEYADCRHPEEVTFTSDLVEDLKRRDFTINAMAYNDAAGLVDVFGGAGDLEQGVVRCVGVAEERFTEDALRVLRAVRFAAQLGFAIEEETRQAMEKLAPNLEKISAERIRVELVKLLTSPHPQSLREAYRIGITRVVLPEFDRLMEVAQNNPHHIYNVGEHTLHALDHVEPDTTLRLAVLFHDFGKPLVETVNEEGISSFAGHAEVSEKLTHQIMRRLKFDNRTLNRVKRLVRWHDSIFQAQEKELRHAIHLVGDDVFEDLLKVMRADVLAQSTYLQREKLECLDDILETFHRIRERGDCLTVRELAVDGRDLMAMGVEKGPRIGEILQRLLELVLDDPEKNEKSFLLEKVREE